MRNLFIWICLSTVTCPHLLPFPVLRNSDPSYFIFRHVPIPETAKRVLRCLILGSIFLHGIFAFLTFLLRILLFTFTTHASLKILEKISEHHVRSEAKEQQCLEVPTVDESLNQSMLLKSQSELPSEQPRKTNTNAKKLPENSFRFFYCTMMKLRIFTTIGNCIAQEVIAAALSIGVTLGCIFITGIVLFVGKLNSILVIVIGIFLLVIIATIFYCSSLICLITKRAVDLVDTWKTTARNNQINKKFLRSIRPLKFNIGPFMYVDKSLAPTCLQMMVEHAVDLMIASKS